jgi:hypothetical protein
VENELRRRQWCVRDNELRQKQYGLRQRQWYVIDNELRHRQWRTSETMVRYVRRNVILGISYVGDNGLRQT